MKYSEIGFRAVYRHFCVFEKKAIGKPALRFPGYEKADSVLCYGYIDHDEGVTLEIIACGIKENGGYRFYDTNKDERAYLRINALLQDEFDFINDEGNDLKERYQEKLASLFEYEKDKDLSMSRQITMLDDSRDKTKPDQVRVNLVRTDRMKETARVRIEELANQFIIGSMLDEPLQDFGYHKGDKIGFFISTAISGKNECYSDLTPAKQLTEEDLKGGVLLREAMRTFNEERTNANLMEVLELCRDSKVWVPFNTAATSLNRKRMTDLMEEVENPDSPLSKALTADSEEAMTPDILRSGDNLFFPVFSEDEEMGEYGEKFVHIEKNFLEAIKLARSNPKDIKGIVIDALTTAFIIPKEYFDVIEQFKTRIVE